MLQAQDVHFCIKNQPIIDQASIDLRPGELTVLVGPNGAGKSTLFKILAGENPCKHGNVRYNGRSIQQYKTRELARIRAVMPQHSELSFPFRAIEVVEMGLFAAGSDRGAQVIEDVMSLTETWHLREKLYGNLSGGEKQRIQFARVLAQVWEPKPFPRYILLDEPVSSMDIAFQHKAMNILQSVKERHVAVLVILHDLNMTAHYADRVVLLKKGLIFKQGSVEDTITSENLAWVFDHPIRVIPGTGTSAPFVQTTPTFTEKFSLTLS
jgi:iron complex transport system ATP-binding protein